MDMMAFFGSQGAISYAWNIPLLAGRVGLSEEEMRQVANFCCFLGCRGVFSLPYRNGYFQNTGTSKSYILIGFLGCRGVFS